MDVVTLYPDYLYFQETSITDASIIFSSNCIQVSGSLEPGDLGTFNYELGIDDIVDVECQWYGKAETAMVKLNVISKDVKRTDAHSPSGIQELIFTVIESNWPDEQERITSLNVRYLAMWNTVTDSNDMDIDEDALLGKNSIFSLKHYFPNFNQSSQDVIYPKGDSDPVSISKRDANLLQPETFINDTIIDFYIKFLKNKIQPEAMNRFHFFNSFFFRKLANLDKEPFVDNEGRTAFLRVRKWTRKLNLFEKDFIFIPVNSNYHWSLIVICHPGEVANFRDEDIEKALKVPCVLHMDSIKGTHAGLKNHIQSYLWEEWKEKKNEVSEDIYSNFVNMRFISLELPQQENSFDCGLFLLHYVELFLGETPGSFSPFQISKLSNFLNVDWFPPSEASLKRAPILRLIYEILEDYSPESSDDCNKEHQSSKYADHITKNGTGNLSGDMSLLASSSFQSSQYPNDPDFSVREFFDPAAQAVLDNEFEVFDQTPTFYQGPRAPIEQEDGETGEQFVYLPSGRTGSPEMDENSQRLWLEELSRKAEHDYNNSSSDTSLSDDDDSSDIGIIENSSDKEEELCQIDHQRSTSVENIDCSSESYDSESSEMLENTASEDLDNSENLNEDCQLAFHQENVTDSVSDDNGKVHCDDNGKVPCDDMGNVQHDDAVYIIGDDDVHNVDNDDDGGDDVHNIDNDGDVHDIDNDDVINSGDNEDPVLEVDNDGDDVHNIGNHGDVHDIDNDDVINSGDNEDLVLEVDEQQAAKRMRRSA